MMGNVKKRHLKQLLSLDLKKAHEQHIKKKKFKLLCGQYYYFPIRSELGSKILKLEFPKIKF